MEVIVENHLINRLICRFTIQKDSAEYIEIHISMDGCITKVEENYGKDKKNIGRRSFPSSYIYTVDDITFRKK